MVDHSRTTLVALCGKLAVSLEAATSAVVRLDETVGRQGRVGEGYRTRLDFQEACALRSIAGELVPVEDLVLVDSGTPIRLSTIELTRARVILQARRHAGAKPPAWTWSAEALFEDRIDVPRDELLRALGDVEWDEDERVDQWLTTIDALPALPVMMKAAVAWDTWLQLEPLHGGAWRAALMAASKLREGGLTTNHLFALGVGARRSRLRYDNRQPIERRLATFLDWTTTGAEAGRQDLKRLSLADQVMRQVAKHKHVDSRLPAFIDLVLSRPVISAELACRELKLSPTGFRRLRESLGTTLREMSGRRRFQVWGVL